MKKKSSRAPSSIEERQETSKRSAHPSSDHKDNHNDRQVTFLTAAEEVHIKDESNSLVTDSLTQSVT